jgi:hypothetical protein
MSLLWKRLGAVLTSIIVGAALLGGCGDVESPMDAVSRSYGLRLFREHRSTLSPSYAERLIREGVGGKVVLNRHTLVIPPDGLTSDETVTVSEPSPSHVVVDLGPDGLRFEAPVELTISFQGLELNGVKEERLTIYWFNSETGMWVDMGGKVDTAEKLVTVWTDHFSRYALSDH